MRFDLQLSREGRSTGTSLAHGVQSHSVGRRKKSNVQGRALAAAGVKPLPTHPHPASAVRVHNPPALFSGLPLEEESHLAHHPHPAHLSYQAHQPPLPLPQAPYTQPYVPQYPLPVFPVENNPYPSVKGQGAPPGYIQSSPVGRNSAVRSHTHQPQQETPTRQLMYPPNPIPNPVNVAAANPIKVVGGAHRSARSRSQSLQKEVRVAPGLSVPSPYGSPYAKYTSTPRDAAPVPAPAPAVPPQPHPQPQKAKRRSNSAGTARARTASTGPPIPPAATSSQSFCAEQSPKTYTKFDYGTKRQVPDRQPIQRAPSIPQAPTPSKLQIGDEAWERLVVLARDDFTEDELGMLFWDTLSKLLMFYSIEEPMEVAKIELKWKSIQSGRPAEGMQSPGGNGSLYEVPRVDTAHHSTHSARDVNAQNKYTPYNYHAKREMV